MRRQIATDLGMVIAPVRIHDDVTLDSHEYAIKVRGGEVARTRIVPGHRLAMNPGDAVPGIAGIQTVEPAFGLPAVWIEEGARAEAEALGYTVVDPESVIVTHLTETIRRHADELLTRQETKKLLDTLKEQNAAAVEEVVPDKLGIGEVQRVLQHLLREGVSIRDLGTVLESIGDRAAITRDPALLAEYARQSLARNITAGYVDETKTLRAISLDPSTSSRRSPSRSRRRTRGSTSRWSRPAPRRSWGRSPARSSRPPAWASGPCSSAPAVSAGTCAGCRAGAAAAAGGVVQRDRARDPG